MVWLRAHVEILPVVQTTWCKPGEGDLSLAPQVTRLVGLAEITL